MPTRVCTNYEYIYTLLFVLCNVRYVENPSSENPLLFNWSMYQLLY